MLGRRAATLLQGPGTDPQAATVLEAAAEQGQEVCVEVVHHRRDGSAFCDEVGLPLHALPASLTYPGRAPQHRCQPVSLQAQGLRAWRARMRSCMVPLSRCA